jgi:hypothetical protein
VFLRIQNSVYGITVETLEFKTGLRIRIKIQKRAKKKIKINFFHICKIEFKVKKGKINVTDQELEAQKATSLVGAGSVKRCVSGSESSGFKLMFNIKKTCFTMALTGTQLRTGFN